MKNLQSLQQAVRSGKKYHYLHFWSHRARYPGSIDASCLSQWSAAPFELDGFHYPTAEHYMMAEKARVFEDVEIEQKVLASTDPCAAKKLGRQIVSFNNKVWMKYRFDIVVRGNVAKFSQNEPMGRFLIETGNKVLVEASPNDDVWGIGLTGNDAGAHNPLKWPGLNLLGFALMAARDAITNVATEENA